MTAVMYRVHWGVGDTHVLAIQRARPDGRRFRSLIKAMARAERVVNMLEQLGAMAGQRYVSVMPEPYLPEVPDCPPPEPFLKGMSKSISRGIPIPGTSFYEFI